MPESCNLTQIWERQKALQFRMGHPYPIPENFDPGAGIVSVDDRDLVMDLVNTHATCLMMEASELKDWTPWKHWSKQSGNKQLKAHEIGNAEHIEEMRFEVVDCLCFMLNCARALGMTPEMLNEYHEKKTGVSHARQDSGTY